MARIDISNDNEFSILLDALSSDITYAHFHYKLLRSLHGAIEGDQYREVFNQSWTFWHLTLEAHEVAMLLRLGRIFDQGKNALSLGNWLQTIRSNLHFFDEPNFRRRLQGNSFVESLAKDSRKPDEHELKQDIGSVVVNLNNGIDSVVKKFNNVRNKYLAHKDPNVLLPSRGPKMVADLSWNDIEHLLSLANRLLSKYSLLFTASVYSTTMVGQDDYKYVLESIKMRIESYKATMAAEMEKYLGK
ncbi:MAG: hypothetical protein ABSD50_12850 [Smithella sp.]|jgi:hypothetical protein